MQSDTRNREVSMLIATRLSVVGIALLTQFVLAHMLLAEGRGIYAVCMLYGTLSGVVFTPGADRGAQYFVMSHRMSLSKALSAAYTVCAVGTVVAAAVMLPLVHSGISFFDNAPTGSFYLAFLLVPAVTISRATLRQVAGLRQFGHLAVCSLIQAATTLSATVGLVWALGLDVNGAIAALMAGHVVSTALGVFCLMRHHELTLSLPSRNDLADVLRYGRRDWMSAVGLAAESTVVALVLGFIATPTEIGLVALAAAIVTRVLVFPGAMTVYLAPRVADDPIGASGLSASFTRIALWAATGLLLAWAALSMKAVALLLPEEFAPVVTLMWVMSAGICVAAASEVLTGHFRASDRPDVASWSVWTGLLTTVGLLLALYPVFGLNGAAWAVTGGHLVRGIILVAVFSRTTNLSPLSVLLPRYADVAQVRNSAAQILIGRRTG